jgi:hypothetical protein
MTRITFLSSIKGISVIIELKVPGAPLHENIQLRIIPDKESGLSEVRFWHKDEFLGS